MRKIRQKCQNFHSGYCERCAIQEEVSELWNFVNRIKLKKNGKLVL